MSKNTEYWMTRWPTFGCKDAKEAFIRDIQLDAITATDGLPMMSVKQCQDCLDDVTSKLIVHALVKGVAIGSGKYPDQKQTLGQFIQECLALGK